MGTHQSFAENFHEEDEEQQVYEESVSMPLVWKNMNVKEEEEEEQKFGGGEEEPSLMDANAIGDPLRLSGKGRKKKYHYKAFEFDGNQYELEDFVLVAPDKKDEKPCVAVIKDITQESVMHFVPMHKKIPKRSEHPGFIVQRVYDHREEKLYKLTDRDYKDNIQKEIDLLLHKIWSLLGDLPDIETEEAPSDQELHSDISWEEEETSKPDQHLKATMQESRIINASEYYCMFGKFKALTGEIHKWLERLLQGVQYMCSSGNNIQSDEKGNNSFGTETKIHEKSLKGRESFTWPDAVVLAIVALEMASYDGLSSDFHKYNQKLQKMLFNLKLTHDLGLRLLVEGLTTKEIVKETVKKEPDESEGMKVTDFYSTF
ncbi:Bromo adjacent-likey (BAH) domain [Quillaja saponaria]|uniref:Bromo adjacent-likey (BAH) domain n=1 Tax=Quillaja saponaria TaxID=32244 RepID=A0AAD7KWY8_QUISA|nr:Bromo adjacent-likey (BAH) domain [Quillaja saponaria]